MKSTNSTRMSSKERDFDRLIDLARRQAKRSGMKRSDIAAAIACVRMRKRSS